MYLSRHFTLREFLSSQTAARRGIPNIPTEVEVANMRELCEFVLEPVRAKFGPVIISSGFRSHKLNPEYRDWETDRKSTRLNSSHSAKSRMPSSA